PRSTTSHPLLATFLFNPPTPPAISTLSLHDALPIFGFGFTIFQFFRRLDTMPGVRKARDPWFLDALSLSLVGAGTLGLIIVLFEYRSTVRHLWSPPYREIAFGDKPAFTPTSAAALVICLTRLLALLIMVIRIT